MRATITPSADLTFTLHQPPLLAGTSAPYVASVKTSTTYNVEALAQRLADEGHINASLYRLMLADLINLMQKLISQGHRINLDGLIQLYPVIKGRFVNSEDQFDPKRHRIVIDAQQTRAKNRQITGSAHNITNANTPVEARQDPLVTRITPTHADAPNTIEPDAEILVQGRNLTLSEEHPDTSVVVEPAGSSPIQATAIQTPSPRHLLFTIPGPLPDGPGDLVLHLNTCDLRLPINISRPQGLASSPQQASGIKWLK